MSHAFTKHHSSRTTRLRTAVAACIAFGFLLAACGKHAKKHAKFGYAANSSPMSAGPSQWERGKESILILRSVREPRLNRPSGCSELRTGFEPYVTDSERHFSFWAVETSARDGRMVDAGSVQVAVLRGCFGPTADRTRQHFYADIEVGDLAFRGRGECVALTLDSPERGLISVRCHLVLSGFPPGYVGGLLTTNTLTSQAPYGGETIPVGYAQASIATIRLWRTR